ncbi:MAG: dockerin type I domain-containing protein [Bacteroidetes bacterium]|nr:dockerin type I domain-containing protein [Bacteroidota bacterium]
MYDNPLNPSVIAGATVKLLNATGDEIAVTTTDSTGHFNFDFVPSGSSIRVSSSLPGGGWNAMDALDIMRHFTGMITLQNLPLIAADVNGGGFVNSVDALLVEKRFVGLIDSFSAGEWVFEEKQVGFPAPGSTQNIVIRGLHVGDVNKSYHP